MGWCFARIFNCDTFFEERLLTEYLDKYKGSTDLAILLDLSSMPRVFLRELRLRKDALSRVPVLGLSFSKTNVTFERK